MTGEQRGYLRPAAGLHPVQRLWWQLPPEWRGPVIGPGIEGWDAITENGDRRIDLTGLPDPFPAELAWMAHWQAADGTRCSVLAMNQLANILRWAIRDNHPFPASMLTMDWDAAAVSGSFGRNGVKDTGALWLLTARPFDALPRCRRPVARGYPALLGMIRNAHASQSLESAVLWRGNDERRPDEQPPSDGQQARRVVVEDQRDGCAPCGGK